MNRASNFFANAGVQGAISTCIVGVIVMFGMARDFRTGDWVITAPLLIATFGLPYLVRNFLIDNFSIVRLLMNGLAMAGLAAFVFLPKPIGPEPLWMRVTILGCLGTYMGCYFWMLSDDNVGMV